MIAYENKDIRMTGAYRKANICANIFGNIGRTPNIVTLDYAQPS